ncbi:MAG: PqqD family protein [Clostridia bacterium]|nr:PqqD family protein [Clostridia bacterium]
MKIRDGFVLRQVADATIVVPAGEASMDFNGMITLNETAAFLWRLLEKETTEEELVAAMLGEYDVDEERAKAGIKRFVEKLGKEGLLK